MDSSSSTMAPKLPHRLKRLNGKKFIFSILLTFVIVLAITYQYNSSLIKGSVIELQPKQVLNEDYVNGSQEESRVDGIDGTQQNVFAQRQERVQRVCASHPHLQGGVHGVFTHPSGVIYCFVPKAGCTFWKRLFFFSALENSTKYENPWSIPRMLVHTDKLRNGRPYDNAYHSSANFPMRFIVSRDPFSRLVSSYLDKFYLPDFWPYLGKIFSQETLEWTRNREPDFLTHHFDLMQSLFEKNSTIVKQASCGKRLTFAAFVKSMIKKPEDHWMPVHKLCNPCQFKPTHIVHIESFASDSKVILKRMGLDKAVEGFTHYEQVNEEIQTIVDYNFGRINNGYKFKNIAECVTEKELAYRLWHNFVWRGYIHPDVIYTIPDSNKCIKDDLLKQLWRARVKGLQDKQAMKDVAKKFKSDLFSTIDKTMYKTLRKTFQMDFEFFGYDNVFTSSKPSTS